MTGARKPQVGQQVLYRLAGEDWVVVQPAIVTATRASWNRQEELPHIDPLESDRHVHLAVFGHDRVTFEWNVAPSPAGEHRPGTWLA